MSNTTVTVDREKLTKAFTLLGVMVAELITGEQRTPEELVKAKEITDREGVEKIIDSLERDYDQYPENYKKVNSETKTAWEEM